MVVSFIKDVMTIKMSHSRHLQCIINATASIIAEYNWSSGAIKERGENYFRTTCSSFSTPTDTFSRNVKLSSSARSPLLFKSPFRQSNMSAVEGSSVVTVTGSESGQ